MSNILVVCEKGKSAAAWHVDQGDVDRRPGLAAEDEARRVRLPAYTEGMDLEARLACRDGGADLEHVLRGVPGVG